MRESLLEINRKGLPSFSARGSAQILTPLKTGEMRRTINGALEYLGRPYHHKYGSEIFCRDQATPALDCLWRGEEIEVGCLQRLCQSLEEEESQQEIILSRPAVDGSIVVSTEKSEAIAYTQVNAKTIRLEQPLPVKERAFITYRPLLKMRVVSFRFETNEWGAEVGWRLILEEI